MTSNKQILLFDMGSVLYRVFFANTSEDDSTIMGLAAHQALQTLNKYFKQFKPHQVVMCYDRTSWRKAYTASELCVSKRPYKGNRRKDMSPAQELKFERYLGHLKEFEALITNHTTIVTLAGQHLEADDLIAGYVQHNPTHDITLISSDSDMWQLLKHPNLTIISPADGKQPNLSKFDDNPEYYLFEKCIRGDSADNVQSAFPGVRATRLKKAYVEPFEMVQLMKTVWTDENKQQFMVEDLYEENRLLIDLEKQPSNIREIINTTLTEAEQKQRMYSMFHFMKYLGKHKLDKIASSFEQYLPLLSR